MKKETIVIETPEKILFSYSIAGLGARTGAFVLDWIFQSAALFLLFFFPYSVFNFSMFHTLPGDSELVALSVAFFLILKFLLDWGYFLFFEILTNGQSPGKKIFRIRVIRSRGEALDFAALALRNLLRGVDSFPFLNLLGGVVVMIDKRSRRLGDIVADTLVVSDPEINLREPDFRARMVYLPHEKNIPSLELDHRHRLTEDELYILRRFFNERENLPQDKRGELTDKLVRQVRERLEIEAPRGVPPLKFLEMVYREHCL